MRSFRKSHLFIAVLLLSIFLAAIFTPAAAAPQQDDPLCGNGSSPDYGFAYDLRQPHWTVGYKGYASEQAMGMVDTILDELDYDSIAQTMILILPQEKVGNPVNCAVHFLRYMKLGLASGERKDNGLVFLVVVGNKKIDVHYGVGLGLPALTASELTNLNRYAEETYQSTGNMDETLLGLVKEYDKVARANYSPLIIPTPTPETIELPSGPAGIISLLCMVCIGIIVLIVIIWILVQLARLGIRFDPPSGGSWGGGGGGFGGFGGGGGGGITRGGGGSGRSGRGN
jgi:uncharacterized protein